MSRLKTVSATIPMVETHSFLQRFPLVYRETATISVCVGWQRIVEDLLSDLQTIGEAQVSEGEVGLVLLEVHQKYGSLRVETSRMTSTSQKAAERAEASSAKTCERCGARGRLRDVDQWMTTLCDSCAEGAAASGTGKT